MPQILRHIFGKVDFGGSGQRNMILVAEINEFAQVQISHPRRSFLTDALHQIAIAADRVSVVIHSLVPRPVITRCQALLGGRHADPVSEPLT
jgi:hypothetical protein